MKRILFVDDEPRVLDGLRRMLRPLRQEWAMRFAPGGPQALELLAGEPADVLVTDMRMPGMDGGELLAEARRRYPHMVRIILTGQAGREAVLRSVRVAHRQLTKPCDVETLKANLLQACALRGLLDDDALRAVVARMDSVPSLPSTYLDIERELESPDCSLQRVGQIIAADVGMAAKTLQLVNSPFFGLRNHVESPAQAVALLGLSAVQSLVLAAHVFSKCGPAVLEVLPLEPLWAHSRLTSALAGRIALAENADKRTVELAGMAGLLHDVGKVVLAGWKPAAYREALRRAGAEGLPAWEGERAVFGTSHAEVGAYLLGLWGLPDAIVEAVAWHHRPRESHVTAFGPLAAVHAADALASELRPGGAAGRPAPLDADYLGRLGLAGRLPAWRELAEKLVNSGACDEE